MKSGFAGSLVVSAGWRGRNLRRGMQDSQKRVNNFGKGIRRIVAATALGVGAFAAGKGLASLLKMSSAGSKAISAWSIAWAKFKQQVARLISGPAARVINWLATGLGIVTDWLSKQTSISGAFRNLVALVKNWLMSFGPVRKAWTSIVGFIAIAKALFKSFVANVRQGWLNIVGFIAAAKALFKSFVVMGSTLVLKLFTQLAILANTVFQKLLDWSIKLFNIWQQIMQFIANATASVAGTIGRIGGLFGFSDSPKSSAGKLAQKATTDIANARSAQAGNTANIESTLSRLAGAINSLDTAARKLNGASVQQGRLQLQSAGGN